MRYFETVVRHNLIKWLTDVNGRKDRVLQEGWMVVVGQNQKDLKLANV